jgi:hypothetical protein
MKAALRVALLAAATAVAFAGGLLAAGHQQPGREGAAHGARSADTRPFFAGF